VEKEERAEGVRIPLGDAPHIKVSGGGRAKTVRLSGFHKIRQRNKLKQGKQRKKKKSRLLWGNVPTTMYRYGRRGFDPKKRREKTRREETPGTTEIGALEPIQKSGRFCKKRPPLGKRVSNKVVTPVQKKKTQR